MGGIAIYDNNMNTLPIAGCQGPLSDRISLQFLQRGEARYGAMMVNSQTITGGHVGSNGDLPNVLLDIPTATPTGYPRFMLVYATTGSGSASGSYVGRQGQLFNCSF